MKSCSKPGVVLLIASLMLAVLASAAAGAVPGAAAGGYSTLVVKGDGTIWGWGRGGCLGGGLTHFDHRVSPLRVGTITDVVDVVTGSRFAAALRTDGTVWTWGTDSWGQGHGDFVKSDNPKRVEGLSGIVGISASSTGFALAVKNDGTVWAWGYGGTGEMGDGSTEVRYRPVQVSGLTDVAAVSAGSNHSVALKKDGTVWAWGDNFSGLLGTGVSGLRRTTAEQVQGLTDVTAISAGGRYTVALKADGTVLAWGHSLPDMMPTQARNTPTVIDGLTGVTAIAAGGDHTLFLKSDGTVWAWGKNPDGQLGTGTVAAEAPYKEPRPRQVQGIRDAVAISAGGFAGGVFSQALVQDDPGKIVLRIGQPSARIGGMTLYAWGENDYGQLGDGSTTMRTSPVKVPIDLTPVLPVDVPPFIEGGRTLVPLRFIGEQLGAEIGWEAATQQITYTKEDTVVILWIGQMRAQVNGEDISLEVPPKIVGGRTVVPLRFVSEAFGAGLQWEGSTQTITITP